MRLTSPAFESGAPIPQKYSCEGNDVSPPLEWSGTPHGASSLALLVDDPDAPSGVWTHWVVIDLPPGTQGLPEGGPLPQGAQVGSNDFRKNSYGGPCPPPGAAHHYHFRMYALDRMLGLRAGASRQDVLKAMEGHILAQGELMGTYQRGRVSKP